jgi:hypothetical protein
MQTLQAYVKMSIISVRTEYLRATGTVNHALDAMILACDLPSPTILEVLNLPVRSLKSWALSVRKKVPDVGPDGVPEIADVSFAVAGFESVLPGNYVEANLSFFNWNRRDSRIQRQEIYGWNKYKNVPTKRTAASALAADLKKTDSVEKAQKIIDNVLHPNLRSELEGANTGDQPGENCAKALTNWLRKTIKESLKRDKFSDHPANQNRKKMLQEFVKGKTDSMPVTIGVTMLRPDGRGHIDITRVGKNPSHIIHRYWADPPTIAKIIGYKAGRSGVNKKTPLVFDWRQSGAIIPKRKSIPLTTEYLLRGHALGQERPDESAWYQALHNYFKDIGIVEYAIIRQGNVVLYLDGT